MVNQWVEHVKSQAKELNISYGCAMTNEDVKKSYKQNKTKTVKETKTVKKENKDFDISDELRNKIMKLGIDKLHNYYKENFNRKIINAKKNPNLAKKMILDTISKIMTEDKYKKLTDLVEVKKVKKVIEEDSSKYKVGDEVIYGSSNFIAGIITKVTKATIAFKPYEISHSETLKDYNMFQTIKTYWDKNNYWDELVKVRKTNHRLYSKNERNPEDFVFKITEHDMGR